MLNNLWVQLGGMGLIGYLFIFSMRMTGNMIRQDLRDNASATRENTVTLGRLVGLMEASLGRQPAQPEVKRGEVA